jgi:hypothetical protein
MTDPADSLFTNGQFLAASKGYLASAKAQRESGNTFLAYEFTARAAESLFEAGQYASCLDACNSLPDHDSQAVRDLMNRAQHVLNVQQSCRNARLKRVSWTFPRVSPVRSQLAFRRKSCTTLPSCSNANVLNNSLLGGKSQSMLLSGMQDFRQIIHLSERLLFLHPASRDTVHIHVAEEDPVRLAQLLVVLTLIKQIVDQVFGTSEPKSFESAHTAQWCNLERTVTGVLQSIALNNVIGTTVARIASALAVESFSPETWSAANSLWIAEDFDHPPTFSSSSTQVTAYDENKPTRKAPKQGAANTTLSKLKPWFLHIADQSERGMDEISTVMGKPVADLCFERGEEAESCFQRTGIRNDTLASGDPYDWTLNGVLFPSAQSYDSVLSKLQSPKESRYFSLSAAKPVEYPGESVQVTELGMEENERAAFREALFAFAAMTDHRKRFRLESNTHPIPVLLRLNVHFSCCSPETYLGSHGNTIDHVWIQHPRWNPSFLTLLSASYVPRPRAGAENKLAVQWDETVKDVFGGSDKLAVSRFLWHYLRIKSTNELESLLDWRMSAFADVLAFSSIPRNAYSPESLEKGCPRFVEWILDVLFACLVPCSSSHPAGVSHASNILTFVELCHHLVRLARFPTHLLIDLVHDIVDYGEIRLRACGPDVRPFVDAATCVAERKELRSLPFEAHFLRTDVLTAFSACESPLLSSSRHVGVRKYVCTITLKDDYVAQQDPQLHASLGAVLLPLSCVDALEEACGKPDADARMDAYEMMKSTRSVHLLSMVDFSLDVCELGFVAPKEMTSLPLVVVLFDINRWLVLSHPEPLRQCELLSLHIHS